jgi:hypothetical protein
VGGGIKTWVFLRRLFRAAGVRRTFDIAAIHPYSANLPGLEYQMRKARRAMADAGLDGRPLLVTEMGVASWGDYPSSFVEGPDGSAPNSPGLSSQFTAHPLPICRGFIR